MAKILHNAIIADIRGRIRDKVYTTYRGTPITRTYNPNVNQQSTPRQLEIRGYFGQLRTGYWNLPNENQQLWEKYGQRKQDTKCGLGAYIQANIRLLAANHPELIQIDSPPPTPGTPPQIQGFTWSFIDWSTIKITWTAPLVSTHYMQIFHRLEWNYSPEYNLHWAHVATVRSDCGEYIFNHSYPPTTDIYIKLRVLDRWGRIGPYTHTIKEVFEMPEAFSVQIQAWDGADYRDCILESATYANLRVALYSGENKVGDGGQINTDDVDATIYGMNTRSFLYAYNGTAWDRLKVESSSQAGLQTGIWQGGNQAVVVQAAADAIAGTNYGLQTRGMLYGWNGATWDRLEVQSATYSNLKVGIYKDATQANVLSIMTTTDVPGSGLVSAAIQFAFDNDPGLASPVGQQLLTIMSNKTTPGTGSTYGFAGRGARTYTWTIRITGAPSAAEVRLEGTIDGNNFYTLDTSTTTTSEMRFVVNRPISNIRANVITLTGGSSPAVTVKIYTDNTGKITKV